MTGNKNFFFYIFFLNSLETIAVTQNYCGTHNFKFVWPEVCEEPAMSKEMIDLHALNRPDLFTPEVLKMAGKDVEYLEELRLKNKKEEEEKNEMDTNEN